ncbi:endonuclease/exonuclease/phosphatase family protein [Adhaeretor mobilis]|uniref:Endonuclease/Exonuclease/phosphatase family protein n=1 Tax=Adhaeretor mobilis TaxID=1930276 RepID=A0A517N0G3_9BACT|nr:endonuclease/exonuclease/phosphatase family protein [Adhaeretor mobilis]QDT00626.1 Endonuclease/Exonuclease/phosphatase family protein [Adhaeretor mobilis]
MLPTLRYLLLVTILCCIQAAQAQTGTFVDRQQSTDLRTVSYNINWDSIFADNNPAQADKFARVLDALDPDVLNLQEIGDPFCESCTPKNSTDVRVLLNTLMPLGGAGWQVYKGGSNVIASKYPLSMQQYDTTPGGNRSQAIALVDLPDAQFASDFYFLNNHYKCCGNEGGFEDELRQQESDSIVNWLRDARTPGGFVDLPPGTPLAIVGDLNLVGGLQPLDTLIDGNIQDEFNYGPDSVPDWDGTPLTDARPLHNGAGTDEYTWRNDNSPFAPGVLDYVIYSDSALDVGNQFVLNTVAMTPAERAATGLLEFDITMDNDGETYDHLPVVVDFRVFAFADSDFDFSRTVDGQDLETWRIGFGLGTLFSDGDSDANGTVDGLDLLAIQREYSGTASSVVGVPEPTSLALALLAFSLLAYRSQKR